MQQKKANSVVCTFIILFCKFCCFLFSSQMNLNLFLWHMEAEWEREKKVNILQSFTNNLFLQFCNLFYLFSIPLRAYIWVLHFTGIHFYYLVQYSLLPMCGRWGEFFKNLGTLRLVCDVAVHNNKALILHEVCGIEM